MEAFPIFNLQKKSWRNFFAYLGPGFLVSIAYIDPGNCKTSPCVLFHANGDIAAHHDPYFVIWFTVQTDLQSGAQYKYGVRIVLFCLSPSNLKSILNMCWEVLIMFASDTFACPILKEQ